MKKDFLERNKARMIALMHEVLEINQPLIEKNSILTFGEVKQTDFDEIARLIPQITPFAIAYGASTNYVFPFISDYSNYPENPLAIDILTSLHVRKFLSEHIARLDVDTVAFPGYHPCTLNDEIHNDDSEQYIFDTEEDDEDNFIGLNAIQKELKENVFDNKIWYLTLHTRRLATQKEIEIYERNKGLGYTHLYKDEEYYVVYGTKEHGLYVRSYADVLLIAVGLSANRQNLVGYITFQTCHNLCD